MSKTTIKVLIALASLGIIVLLGIMIYFLNDKHLFFFSHNYYQEVVKDETYQNNFESIKINGGASDIFIKHSKDETIRVVIYGDQEIVQIEKNLQDLEIDNSKQKCHFFCWNIKRAKIEIYLPENYSGLIDITNAYGDILIAEYSNATINIEEDYGDITLGNALNVNITNDLGNIEIGKVQNALVEASAGDISIEEANDLKVQNDLGDIFIKKVTNYLDVKNNCGDITINNVYINKNSKIVNDLGNIEIGNSNAIYFDVHSSLGDVDINHNYRESDTVLKINNNCGDILVKN